MYSVTVDSATAAQLRVGSDGWTIAGPPPGSAPNPNNFIVTTPAGFPEGAVIATPDSLYFGFGFEGNTDPSTGALVMDRTMRFLRP